MMMAITGHAEERIHERMNIPKRARKRMTANALERGLKRQDAVGSLRRMLDALMHRDKADNIIVYNNAVFCFRGNILLTVLKLPYRFRKCIKKRQQYKE